MTTQNIFPIAGGAIEMGTIDFDLLTVGGKGNLTVFCPSGSTVTNELREDLVEETKPFFIKVSDKTKFLNYTFDRIEKLVSSQYVSTSDKVDLMFMIGKRLMLRLHKNPLVKSNVEQFGRFVKSYIDLMLHTRQAATKLIELSSSQKYVLSHSFNVGTFCMLIGQKLFGNIRRKLWELGVGGMLLDIGMNKVDRVVLNKKGKLTLQEAALVRKHSIFSSDVVGHHELDPLIQGMVRHHHERYDGSGYPNGIAGEQIPLYARIAAVADVYDAITSDRAYKKQANIVTALAEMYSQAEKFDPHLLDTLARVALKSEKLIRAFKNKYLAGKENAALED